MKEKNFSLNQIVKGQPIFKRHLYISSALFVVIILITTFILIQLSLDSLRDRINAEMSTISEVNAQKIGDRIQSANLRSAVLEKGADLQWNDEIKARSEEHTSELQSRENLVCRLLLEKNKISEEKWETNQTGM